MQMYYETDRLILRILHENSAAEVLDFFIRNKDIFERWEPDRPWNFYTREYQAAILKCEFELVMKMNAVRFWIFLKESPDTLIGTVSFQNVMRSVFQSCCIGYKMDKDYQQQGYATEAISTAISIIATEMGLHRIEAFVAPNNTPSIRLLERLGFVYEGIRRSCIYLHSNWTDHLQYSFICSD